MNYLDKIITWVAPGWGVRRAAARFTLERAQELARGYEGAGKGRRTANWKTDSTSADAEAAHALETLRNRSRDMVRNNPFALKAVSSLTNNVVGTGIRPNFITRNEKKFPKENIKLLKEYWKDWAETKEIDFDGNLNAYGMMELLTRSMIEGGDCFMVRRWVKSSVQTTIPVKIKMLEGDHLDRSKTFLQLTSGGYTENGIEYNADGQRVAYWLYDQHPGNTHIFQATSRRYPVEDVIHVYQITRIGQQNGIPKGTPSILRLKDFDEYEDAQLVKQKIAACFAVFISGKGSDAIPGDSSPNDSEPREKLAPGIIERLNGDSTVSFASPPQVNGQAEYRRGILLGAAAGYETTYEILSGDLSNVNFTSYRAGWIEFLKTVASLQNNTVIMKVCDGMFRWMLDALKFKESWDTSPIRAEWTVPRREMIQPVDETNAMIMQVQNYLTSYSESLRELGFNPEDILEEIKSERELLTQMGLPIPGTTTQPGQNVNTQGAGNDPTADGADLNTPQDVEAEAKAKLKGTVGGVQGILQIQASVAAGTTTYDAGLAILEEIYGFETEKGKKILGDPESAGSAKKVASNKDQNAEDPQA